jgi:N-acetyl-gamma-glutamyl-phosphate reductase
VAEVFPALRGRIDLRFEAVDPASLAGRVELAFTALPHAASASAVAALRDAGVPRRRSLGRLPAPLAPDLSAVVRRAPGAVAAREAVYGLPELHRAALRARSSRGARLLSHVRAAAARAALRAGLVETRGIHIDAKSGVSGAGRTLADGYLFGELDGNAHAYKPGHAHRHAPRSSRRRAWSRAPRCA